MSTHVSLGAISNLIVLQLHCDRNRIAGHPAAHNLVWASHIVGQSEGASAATRFTSSPQQSTEELARWEDDGGSHACEFSNADVCGSGANSSLELNFGDRFLQAYSYACLILVEPIIDHVLEKLILPIRQPIYDESGDSYSAEANAEEAMASAIEQLIATTPRDGDWDSES